MKNIKKKLIYVSLVFITLLLILTPQKSIYYAKSGLELCADVIIPSLFPFFVCSGLLIYSGFSDVLAKISKPVMKPLFNVNPAGSTAFILGIISGYPLGALTTCQLYEKSYLSKSEAERLLAFCNNSGPLFIMGAVGVSLYHSVKIGILLYISHILSAIITGFVFRFYKKDTFSAPQSVIGIENSSFSKIFQTVLYNSIQNILTVCGAVLFFSAISGLIMDILPLNEILRNIVGGLLEFTSGVNNISKSVLPLFQKIVISSFIVGFAGLSVHFQVLGIVAKYGLSLFPYIIGKVIQASVSALVTFLLLRFLPREIYVFSPLGVEISGSFFMTSLFMIISVFSVIFIALSGIIFLFFKKSHLKHT